MTEIVIHTARNRHTQRTPHSQQQTCVATHLRQTQKTTCENRIDIDMLKSLHKEEDSVRQAEILCCNLAVQFPTLPSNLPTNTMFQACPVWLKVVAVTSKVLL